MMSRSQRTISEGTLLSNGHFRTFFFTHPLNHNIIHLPPLNIASALAEDKSQIGKPH